MHNNKNLKQIKNTILFFIIALILSGATAIPVNLELTFILKYLNENSTLYNFIHVINEGLISVNKLYPFIFYAFDWLAFAHFIIAILFYGAYKDPIKNKWIIEFGIIACLLIIPYAFIAGHFRSIPIYWRLIDCSFGILGLIPLLFCLKKINTLKTNL